MGYDKNDPIWDEGGAPGISAARLNNIETQYDEMINLFDAHTILMAIADDDPAPLTMGASTMLARLAAGNVIAATPAQIMALLSGQAGAEFLFNTQKIGGVVDPTTDQQAATKKYVDDNASKLIVSETEVFSGESPAAGWVDLNLSGTVGSKATMVILKFNFDTAILMAVRKNGDTDAFQSCNPDNASGAAYAANAGATAGYYVLIATTDTSGILEWYASAAETGTIDIIAYIN